MMQTQEFLKGIFISCRIRAAKRNLLITQDVSDFCWEVLWQQTIQFWR